MRIKAHTIGIMSPPEHFGKYLVTIIERGERKMAGRKKCAPVKTTEARENQIANLALDLAEEQIRNGTAASSVIVHFLKLITTREKLENDKLRSDLKVAEAKIKQIEDQKDIKDLYEKALAAMKSYAGFGDDGDGYDNYDEDIQGFN